MFIPMRKPTITDPSDYHEAWEAANALLYRHYDGMRGFSFVWSDASGGTKTYTPGPIDDELASALMIPIPFQDEPANNGLFLWHGFPVRGGVLDGVSLTLMSRTEEVPLYWTLAFAGDLHYFRLGVSDESWNYGSLRYFSIPEQVVEQGDVAMASFIRDTYMT